MSSSVPSPRRRSFIVLAGVIILAIAGWSIGWFLLRDGFVAQLDRALAGASKTGNVVACSDRKVEGFPFRFEVSCSNLVLMDKDGRSIRTAGFRSVALVYKPWHVITEAQAPALVRLPALGVDGIVNWSTAHSSLKLSQDGLSELDVEIIDPASRRWSLFDQTQEGFAAENAQIHLRHTGSEGDDLLAAVSLRALDFPLLPQTLAGSDYRLSARIQDGAALLRGRDWRDLLASSPDGLRLDDIVLEAGSGELRVDLGGSLQLHPDGQASGELLLSANKPELLIAKLGDIWPEVRQNAGVLTLMATAFQKKDKETGETRIDLPVKLDHGALSLGGLPLGRLPRLEI